MSFFQKGKIILLLMIACSFGQHLQAQLHWESMVLESDTWKYLPATSEPASTVQIANALASINNAIPHKKVTLSFDDDEIDAFDRG
jgi:hypothetical protein